MEVRLVGSTPIQYDRQDEVAQNLTWIGATMAPPRPMICGAEIDDNGDAARL